MRLVLTSDLHGFLPPVQTCDVLLIAGDVCPIQNHKLDFQADWLKWEFIPWLRRAPARQKIFIAGNHDFIFYEQPNFIYEMDWPGIYLRDEGCEFEGIHFWGSPWANELPGWPFTAPEEELQRYWDRIPTETQVLMVHGPPLGYGDVIIGRRTGDELHVGSRSLDETLARLPNLKLMVFGHIHEGAGVYRHASGLTLVNAALMDVSYNPVNMPRMYEL
jgi:Icc-related predicted phosphoesterase